MQVLMQQQKQKKTIWAKTKIRLIPIFFLLMRSFCFIPKKVIQINDSFGQKHTYWFLSAVVVIFNSDLIVINILQEQGNLSKHIGHSWTNGQTTVHNLKIGKYVLKTRDMDYCKGYMYHITLNKCDVVQNQICSIFNSQLKSICIQMFTNV